MCFVFRSAPSRGVVRTYESIRNYGGRGCSTWWSMTPAVSFGSPAASLFHAPKMSVLTLALEAQVRGESRFFMSLLPVRVQKTLVATGCPLHDIAITSVVWCLAHKRGVEGELYIARYSF